MKGVNQEIDTKDSQSSDDTIIEKANLTKDSTNSSLSLNSKNYLFGEDLLGEQGIRENSMIAYCAFIDDDPASGQNNPIIKEFIGIKKIVYSTAATLLSFIKQERNGMKSDPS